MVCDVKPVLSHYFISRIRLNPANSDWRRRDFVQAKTESTKDNWILAPGETEKEFVLRQISPLIANFSGEAPGVKLKKLHQGATGADFLRAVRRQIAFHRPSNVYTEDENYIYV